MPFPSATGTKKDVQDGAWDGSRQIAASIKAEAESINAASAAGPISLKRVLDFQQQCVDAKDYLTRARAVPGIGTYVQNQLNEPARDIGAEFTAMLTEIDNTIAWVVANFPKDASNNLQALVFDASNRWAWKSIASGQLAGYRARLAALIATID